MTEKVKLAVMGDKRTGKTTLINKLLDSFGLSKKIGNLLGRPKKFETADFEVKTTDFTKKVTAEIYEYPPTISRVPNIDGIILLVDLTNSAAFTYATQVIQQNPDKTISLVATKNDSRKKLAQNAVDFKAFAAQHGISNYFLLSRKDTQAIDQAFSTTVNNTVLVDSKAMDEARRHHAAVLKYIDDRLQVFKVDEDKTVEFIKLKSDINKIDMLDNSAQDIEAEIRLKMAEVRKAAKIHRDTGVFARFLHFFKPETTSTRILNARFDERNNVRKFGT